MNRDTVVFGHMHEDHSVELALTARMPTQKCLVIASGGDLVLSLATAGHSVLAVDSNPAQIALVRLKIDIAAESGAASAARWMVAGSPALSERARNAGFDPRLFSFGMCFCGRVDRVLRRMGPFVAWLLRWPSMRPGVFRRMLTALLQRLLPPGIRLLHGSEASRAVNGNSITLMRRRLLSVMSRPDAALNPLLASTLGRGFGVQPPDVWREAGIAAWSARAASIEMRVCSLECALHEASPATFGLISLSNLADILAPPAWRDLLASAYAALAPGGYIVARSMLHESVPIAAECGFADITAGTLPECGDSSPLCPVVWVGRRAGEVEVRPSTLARASIVPQVTEDDER
jgi:hypothetical protein